MSLPNQDDDDDRKPPWRGSFGHGDRNSSSGIYPIKKLTVALDDDDVDDDDDEDARTSAETSVGSMSFSSDMTSVVAGGGGEGPAVPQTAAIANTESAPYTPILALTMDMNMNMNMTAANENDSNSIRSSGSNNYQLVDNEVAIRERRRQNLRQLQQLGIATGVTFSLFLYLLIPTALLLSMILFGGVSAAFLTRLAVYLQWEFHSSILGGRGIGDYLPQGMYQALTSSSLHDFLTDPDGIFGVSEHMPYIMLYMIPGLTPEQRNEYVSRLSPIHQQLLRNDQGLLGYLHNRNRHRTDGNNVEDSSFLMRFIMGDERLRQQQQQLQIHNPRPSSSSNSNSNNRLELPPTIPEGASWGDASELGADDDPTNTSTDLVSTSTPITSELVAMGTTIVTGPGAPSSSGVASSMAAAIPAIVSPIVGRAVVLNESPPQAVSRSTRTPSPVDTVASGEPNSNTRPRPGTVRENNERRTAIPEDVVLFDAIGTAMSNIVGEATQTVRTRARESVRSAITGPVFRVSIGATTLGLGIGAVGLLSGAYDAESLMRPVTQLFRGLFGGSSSSQSGGRSSNFSLPTSSVLVGATLLSGTTAVVLGAFGIYRGDYDCDDDGDSSAESKRENSNATKLK